MCLTSVVIIPNTHTHLSSGSAIKSKAVKRALQENGQWATFVKPESGALSKLCDEQVRMLWVIVC